MDSLVQDRIYRRIALMDYQGVCMDKNNPYSAAVRTTYPASHTISWIFNYMVSLTATWLALLPSPVSAWAHYESGVNYLDKDLDDPNYSDDYDDDDDGDEDGLGDVVRHDFTTSDVVLIVKIWTI